MSKNKNKNLFDLKLKEDITSEDLQKIQILQNHTIIDLLSVTTSTAEALINQSLVSIYKEKLEPFIYKEVKTLKDPDNLKPESRIQYDNLKRRLDSGEDISQSIKDLGFEDYFD